MVLNNLVFPLYCGLQDFARRGFCPLYLRATAVFERKQQALPSENGCGNRVKEQIPPSSQAWSYVSRGTAWKMLLQESALKALDCSMAPQRLCSLCFTHAGEQSVVCCCFLLVASYNSSGRRAGWVGAHQLAPPSTSTCLCCFSTAGAVGSLCGWLLPSDSLV